MNQITRSAYVRDCQVGLTRWNRAIAKAGFAAELVLPSERFNRRVGLWAGLDFGIDGTPSSRSRNQAALPSDADRSYVDSLMVQVVEPGRCANWIAPPDRGINKHGPDYEYVRAA